MKKIVLLMLLVFTTLFTGCFTESNTKVEGVLITSDKYIIAQGETLQLDAVVYPEGVDYSNVKWVSYDEDVATISSSGLVTGVAKGTAVITISVDGNVSSMTVNVEEAGVLTLYSSSFGMGAGGLSVWEGYGAVETDLTVDGYDKVINVDIVDAGWMSLVFNNLDTTIPDEYDQISFKIKTEDLETIKLYLMGQELEVTIADGTELDNGWYEVTVPFSDFTGTGNADGQIAFIHAVAGAEFYVTDITLNSTQDDSDDTTGDDSSDTGDTTGDNSSSDIFNGTIYSSTDRLGIVTLSDWDSGSTLTEVTTDATYGNVYEVTAGSGWGAPTACIAFMDLGDYQTDYTQITFKVKSSDLTAIYVKIPEVEKSYAFADTTDLGNGWYQVTVPFSDLTGAEPGTTQIGIHGGWDNGGTFYITDIAFEANDTSSGGGENATGMDLYTSSEGAIDTNIGEPGWGSGSSLVTLNNTTEGSYTNVMEWAMGTGWGGPAVACGFNGLSDLTSYTTFKAKFKYTDTNSATAGTFEVQMVGAPTQAKIIYDTDTDNWTGLDNGWIEISLPLSEFGSVAGVTQMVLIVKDDTSNPVYFTDISFE